MHLLVARLRCGRLPTALLDVFVGAACLLAEVAVVTEAVAQPGLD